MNLATKRKRNDLLAYIQREVIQEPAVQGVVVIGSVAKGIARDDSDIDAVIFLDPLDLYAVPAEAKWQPENGSFHGIMETVENPVQLDFKRVDLAQWSEQTHVWPEALCAELCEGWIAFDRSGNVATLIAERAAFTDARRQSRLDEAVVRLNWLLSETTTDRTWTTLGPSAAHSRLHAAYDYLVQGLFAYNYRWRPLRSRELADLVALPWLPEQFEAQLLLLMNALSTTQAGYRQRVSALRACLDELVTRCQQDGLFGEDAISDAFIRQHDEPGRNWNMAQWNAMHVGRHERRLQP